MKYKARPSRDVDEAEKNSSISCRADNSYKGPLPRETVVAIRKNSKRKR